MIGLMAGVMVAVLVVGFIVLAVVERVSPAAPAWDWDDEDQLG